MESILGIDIGSSTTKIIEFKNEICNKTIIRHKFLKEDLDNFIRKNNIEDIDKLVFTGIGAYQINPSDYKYQIEKVDEFEAISRGGLYLSNKEEAIIVSVGTGTALIEATKEKCKHLGGTGVGAGTLFNLSNRLLGINSFDKIYELSKKGNIEKIDLRIGDVTQNPSATLPLDLTLSNFGKFETDSKKEDILLGFINMIFEVIGMMAAFATINSKIKDVVLIGNITVLPIVEKILNKIQETHKIRFSVCEDAEYAVALGAVINSKG